MIRKLLIVLLILAMASSVHAAYKTGGVAKTILSNGVTVLTRREPGSKVAAIEVFIRMGAEDEDASNAGIGQLLAGAILSSTETRSALKLSRLFGQVGGNFHSVWQPNYLEVSAVTVPDMADETISLLADAVTNSTFDQVAVENARKAVLRESERANGLGAALGVIRHLVQKGTPYDRPYLGDPSKVAGITRAELKSFYEKNLSADRIVISVVGEMDVREVTRKIEVCFGNVPRRSSKREIPTVPSSSGADVSVEREGASAYVMAGVPLPGVESKDCPALCVANVLLGANKSSLLFRNVREGLGLGYEVGSMYPAQRGCSYLVAYLGLDSSRATPEVITLARKAVLDQIETLRTGAFTDDDLERAKRYLIGIRALDHERTADRARELGRCEAIGLGYQYDFLYGEKISAVTRAQVEEACKRYLSTPSVSVVMPPSSH